MRRLLSDEWDEYADPADMENSLHESAVPLYVLFDRSSRIVPDSPPSHSYSIESCEPITAAHAARYSRSHGC